MNKYHITSKILFTSALLTKFFTKFAKQGISSSAMDSIESIENKIKCGDYVTKPKTHDGGLKRKKLSGILQLTFSSRFV